MKMKREVGRGDHGEPFEALLRSAQAGSPRSWEQVFTWLSPAVAGYLRMQGARDVDDLTSEVFLGVFRGIRGFRGTEAAFRSWVFVIAHHRIVDERRHTARSAAETVELQDSQGEPARSSEDDAIDSLATARLGELCDRLATDQRDVLMLRITGDLTVEQVAEVLGKSAGAVKQLQRRGLEALRRILSHEGVPL